MKRWARLVRQPRALWGLVVLGIALVTVPTLTWCWVEEERGELVRRFSQERLVALKLVAREVEESIKDVGDALSFVARVMRTGLASSPRELRVLLVALLGTSRSFRGLVLARSTDQPWMWIDDPQQPVLSHDLFKADVRVSFDRLAARGAPRIVISPAIKVGKGSHRIFAMRLPRPWRRVALVVDMEPHIGLLRLAAADPQTHLLVIGPWGSALTASDPVLRRAVSAGPNQPRDVFSLLLRRMRRGEEGTLRIPRSEASRLQLGNADVIAAYFPLRLQDSGHFSVATLTSLVAIRRHERSLFLRLGLGAGTVMLLLLGLGAYVLGAGFRQASMQEKLRHAEVESQLHEIAQKILESIPSGVLLLDETDRVTEVNRALRARLPFASSGRRLSEVFGDAGDKDTERLILLISEARRQQAPQSLLAERSSLFGGESYYRIHAVPLQPASQKANLLLVLDDITEIKALEEQLLRTEKLATTGTLAAGIAHEIGTPLSVVRGRSEYILSKLESESPHAAGLKIVIEQTDRIVRTIRELLDFSRPSHSLPDRADGATVVERCVDLLRYELQRRQIRCSMDVDADLPPVAANPDQLQQVLVNLLMNAVDASQPGGAIEIHAHRVTVPAEEPDHPWIQLEVRDHGSGIEPATLHRVFDPFFTTKKRGQGTGLGLFIVAHIVQSHGGRIDLDSAPGRGTRVLLRWPILVEDPS